MLAKKLGQKKLVDQLDVVSDALEELAAADLQMIADAGFIIQFPTRQRYTGALPAPTVLRAGSTGKHGEVRVVLKDTYPEAVLTHCIEYSSDQGQSWSNGFFHNRQNFVIEDLPYSPNLWLHIKSVGQGNTVSKWPEPVRVSVI